MLTFLLMLVFASFSAFLTAVYATDVEVALATGEPVEAGTRFVMTVMFPAVLLLGIAIVVVEGVHSGPAEDARVAARSFFKVIVYGEA